jgi:DNA-binding response OmpR family regulator
MLHILLVEDNAADVLMVREAIRTSSVNADLMIAYDGEQALTILNKPGFGADLVMLDLNLPLLDGFCVLEKHPLKDGPPFIVLSGSDSPGDQKRALELGAKEYVVKPPSFRGFIEAVQGALTRWSSTVSRVRTA